LPAKSDRTEEPALMSTSSESEWTTRKKRINPQLEASGWQVEAFARPSRWRPVRSASGSPNILQRLLTN